MADYKDYYKILGVSKTAGEAEIKKAFKTAARKYHPDLHPETKKAEMTEKFKDINEAYEVLSDKQKRAVYDQVGNDYRSYPGGRASRGAGANPYAGAQQGNFGGGQSHSFHNTGGFDAGDFSDFFQSIFGGAGGGFGGMADIFGGGAGAARRSAAQTPQDTEAELSISLEDAYNAAQMRLTLPNGKTVSVKIPKGITDGQRIKLKGYGETTRRGAGDLYLTIRIKPHPDFTLKGKDLYTTLTIAPWTAALGGKADVPTLAGRTAIKLPAQTHTGKKLKLSGKGLGGGDLYVEIKIDIPSSLSAKQKKLLEQLAEIS